MVDDNGTIVWNRSYQLDMVTRGVAVRRANDDPNGFILLGHTQSLDDMNRSMFVMRVDPLGNPIWTKTYGRSLGRQFFERGEIRACGTGYIVCGSVASATEGGELGYLLKIDDFGVAQWMRFYQDSSASFDFTRFNDVKETATGFVVTGQAFSLAPFGMFQNTTETLIMSTDSLGNPIWANQYPFDMGADAGHSIELLSQGYAVVGFREPFGIPSTQLFTTDVLGNVNWFRQIDTVLDGGYTVAGPSANGTLHVLAADEIIFHGGNFSDDAALLRFDSLGTLTGAQSLGPDYWQFATSSVVEPGGGVATGYTFVGPTSPDGVTKDYYLARTDLSFVTGCYEMPALPPVTSPTVAPIPMTFVPLVVTAEDPLFPTDDPLVWSERILCGQDPCLMPVPVSCSLVPGVDVELSWPPLPATVATAEIWRNGSLLSTVTGTTFTDLTPPFGSNTYELRLSDMNPACPVASSSCIVQVSLGIPAVSISDVIFWPARPFLEDPIICWNDDLETIGRTPLIVSSLDFITPQLGASTGRRPVVWVSLGQFPFDYSLTQQDAQILSSFLSVGGSLYIEGADVAFNNFNQLAQLDGVIGVADGDAQGVVPDLVGLDTGLGLDATSLSAPYSGSGNSVDHLVPDGPGAAAVFQNGGAPMQTTAVYYDASAGPAGSGTHRVISSSTLILGYEGDRPTLQSAFLSVLSPEARFLRGDANGDGSLDIGDALFTLVYLFSGGAGPCLDAMDADDDGVVSLGDPLYTLPFLFSSGPLPPAPWPACGFDSTVDPLGCRTPSTCP